MRLFMYLGKGALCLRLPLLRSRPSSIYSGETEHLVKKIEHRFGRALVPNVRSALLQVPLHLFVESYYQQYGNHLRWDLISFPSTDDVYQDEALVTKVDKGGHPICSSSQPSVMALQLEALDLHPGLSVLEIGTGTGYNAALMDVLVRPTGHVTSIDIDPELVSTAIQHLASTGAESVLATKGDGFEGYLSQAPYDRVLATCAVRSLPRTWVAQLALGGLLVANLRLNLVSVFLLLKKIDTMTLRGCFLDICASYMEMYNAGRQPPSPRIGWKVYDAEPRHELQLPANLSELFAQPAYSLLLQCLLPHVIKKYRAFPDRDEIHLYLMDPSFPGEAILVEGNHVTLIGTQEHLEKRLLQSIEWYDRFHPTIEDYQVIFAETQAQIHLGDMCFSLEI